jgi:predicted transcriptional regulator
MKRTTTSFRLNPEVVKLLKLYAVANNYRYNELIEEAILEYLAKRGVEIPEELKQTVDEKSTVRRK